MRLDASGVPVGWKRFVDQRLGFAFSYPPDWKVRNPGCAEATGPDGLSVDVIVYPGSRLPGTGGVLTVTTGW